MADSDPSDDLRQFVAHLEALRRAGLTDLPRVNVADLPEIVVMPRGDLKPDPPRRESDEVRQAPIAKPNPPVSSPALAAPLSENSMASSSSDRESALPGLADTRPAPPKRSQPAPAAKLKKPPVSSFFDQSRVPFESPVVPVDRRPELLQVLADEVAACTKCPHLAATRTQTVFQSGTPSARLMFIGEAPGADEDRLGEPFVGRAGQLLTDIVSKGMGLNRSDIYIANILKCRPPENRNPLPDEMANCRGYLDRQIEIVRPEFICLLGKVAVGAILETSVPMKTLRLRWHRYRDIPTIVTWHPAYLLRNPEAKKDTWADIQMLMAEMGIKPPKKT
jgi:DNA polymerase